MQDLYSDKLERLRGLTSYESRYVSFIRLRNTLQMSEAESWVKLGHEGMALSAT